ncbi:DUF4386 domain-containing protein [Arenimonas oryziterrae]|uniref:DUF4386 domain-containing protein n=1 Tax=Arenimonas oryziterrae DSM 21050 = YC6267 TaxID=1121015 RepID=A0A091AUY3_9GAMM|nr:DUF4386 domain-containing protein [Arenimonas oryziterrae]KFN43067.1 hypothetical protein N789_10925 [Arenimonas oryziterrae DSM 21050 = YC6267]
MNTNASTARLAGLLYLIVVLTGIFSLAYVPSQLIVAGDAAATFERLVAGQSLFRQGIAAGFVCYTAFLLLPLVLYRLLSPSGKTAAVLMVAFAIVSVPLSLVNLGHKLDVLTLISGADYLHVFTAEQLQTQVMLALAAYSSGLLVAKIFWGLWLLPFGYLVFTSRLLPRVLGLLLMAGCVGYLIDVAGRLLVPAYPDSLLADYATRPAALGEIGTCLWLLIFGARASAFTSDTTRRMT